MALQPIVFFKQGRIGLKSTPFLLPMLLLFCSLFVGMTSSSHATEDTIVIIAHNGVSDNSITIAEAKRIFLKERSHWKTGNKTFPINATSESEIRKIFQSKVLDMDNASEKAYWQKMKIKSGINPPPEFNDVQRVIFSLKDSIGYCFKSDHKSGTSKILLTI
jgi:hypothetical protein